MIIKNKHPHNANAHMILPHVGKVKLENGQVDVPEEAATALLQNQNDWYTDVESVEETGEVAKPMDEEQKAQFLEAIEGMTHEELLAVAAESQIKGANLFKSPNKVESLRKLIIKNVEKL